jgi:hypothetical protein
MLEDWWAHHYFENPKALDAVEDDTFDMDAELAKLEAGDDWEAL